jgi:hypothetical protein
MHKMIACLVKALPRAKSTPLSSYLIHLYFHKEVLIGKEG